MQGLKEALAGIDLSGVPDEPVSEPEPQEVIGTDDLFVLEGEVESTDLPEDVKPEIATALSELDQARSHLIRGNYRAAIQFAGDALNRVAVFEDLHGYATY